MWPDDNSNSYIDTSDYSGLASGASAAGLAVPMFDMLPGDVSDAQQMAAYNTAPPAAVQAGMPWYAGAIQYGFSKAIDNAFPSSPSGVMGNTYGGSTAGANGHTYSLAPTGAGGGVASATTVRPLGGIPPLVPRHRRGCPVPGASLMEPGAIPSSDRRRGRRGRPGRKPRARSSRPWAGSDGSGWNVNFGAGGSATGTPSTAPSVAAPAATSYAPDQFGLPNFMVAAPGSQQTVQGIQASTMSPMLIIGALVVAVLVLRHKRG